MILWNGEPTKICYLDSCILTFLLSENKLQKKILNSEYVYAISIFNLYERCKNKEYYAKTLDLLGRLPVIIFKHFDQLLDTEIKYYHYDYLPIFEMVAPYGTLVRPEVLKGLRKTMESKDIQQHANLFNSQKQVIIDGYLSLRRNFTLNKNMTSSRNADQFVLNSMVERLTSKSPAFMEHLIEEIMRTNKCWQDKRQKVPKEINKQIQLELLPNIYKFSSWAIPLYLAFYKYYVGTDKPKISDVADLAMSSVYAYCDVIMTEHNQGNKILMIKKNHPVLQNTEIWVSEGQDNILPIG